MDESNCSWCWRGLDEDHCQTALLYELAGTVGEEMLERMKIFIISMIILAVVFPTSESYATCDEKEIYCSIPGGTRKVNGVE